MSNPTHVGMLIFKHELRLAWQLSGLHDPVSSLLRSWHIAPPNKGASSMDRDLVVSPPPHSALQALQADQADHLQSTGVGHTVGDWHGSINAIGWLQPTP
jgi:hypothetical protein